MIEGNGTIKAFKPTFTITNRITEGLVREIHKRLVAGVRGGAAARGEYRIIQNFVVNSTTGETAYTPPPAHDVPIMMAELVDWLNQEKEVHPVLVSGISQFQFVHIHPFLDGNGRTSRLLSTLCLYRAGYDFKRLFTISAYYDQDRAGILSGNPERPRARHGHDRLAGIFRRGSTTQLTEVRERGEQAIETTCWSRAPAFGPPGQSPRPHPGARQSDHPGFRGLMPRCQPSESATRSESDGGPGSDRPGRRNPSSALPVPRKGLIFTTGSRQFLRHLWRQARPGWEPDPTSAIEKVK